MSLFDGLRVAGQAISTHRLRSEIAAENLANVYTPGYKRQEVMLQPGTFGAALSDATGASPSYRGASDAFNGAVRVTGIREVATGPYSHRQNALRGVVDMMSSKSAYELNVRAATMMKSMALASLEIGRGS